MLLYFAYGMNTHLDGMSDRCPGAKSLGYAALPGHRFRFARHADVVVDLDATVQGVLWEIDIDHLQGPLDSLEGYPYYYDRKMVKVLHRGQTKDAWVYFMQPGNPDHAPHRNYFDLVVEGYRQNTVPLDQLYNAFPETETSH